MSGAPDTASAAGDTRVPDGVSIDLVTVVFGAELGLLTLQARSIERHVDAGTLGAVIVVVNDADETGCRRAIEAMRAEYGRFAERLRVVVPEELLIEARGPWARLEAAFVARWRDPLKRLLRRRRRNPAGWRGNNGWSMQQAFKLLSVGVGDGTHLVFLDAKNHFLRPVGAADFVAADGRARTRALVPDAKQRRWIEASFARLGLAAPAAAAPPTVTPVAIERAVLAEAVETLTARLGPLQSFFALRRGRTSEFMLLYAAVDAGEGRWWVRFADALPASSTVFASAGADALLAALREIRAGSAPLMGVHRRQLARLDPACRDELLALWSERGLVRDARDFERLFRNTMVTP